MSYRLLVFDFDGTLVDTLGDIAYYANSVLTEYGHAPCSLKQARASIGLGVHELLKGVAPGFLKNPEKLEEAVTLFKTRYRQKPVRETRPFPHVEEILSGRLSGVKKAIITNKPQDITLMILNDLNLRHYFEEVIGMNAGHPPKPDPSSLLYLIKKSNVSAEQTVYIGDSRIDAQTCLHAGVDFAWMDYGYDGHGDFAPRFKFSSAGDWPVLSKARGR